MTNDKERELNELKEEKEIRRINYFNNKVEIIKNKIDKSKSKSRKKNREQNNNSFEEDSEEDDVVDFLPKLHTQNFSAYGKRASAFAISTEQRRLSKGQGGILSL